MTAIQSALASPSRTQLVDRAAGLISRYGLVLVIGWIGILKFSSYEAQGIAPLVSNSPLMSWLYDVFSVSTFSALLGVFEVGVAVLLAVKPLFPKISALGSVLSIGLFLGTLSFLFSTPGIGEASAGGFPLLSMTGQFLIKDVVLLGVSVWTLSDALRAVRAADHA